MRCSREYATSFDCVIKINWRFKRFGYLISPFSIHNLHAKNSLAIVHHFHSSARAKMSNTLCDRRLLLLLLLLNTEHIKNRLLC